MQSATALLEAQAAAATGAADRVALQRLLLEVCAIGHDWPCVARTVTAALPALAADQRFAAAYPEAYLHQIKLHLAYGNDAEIAGLLRETPPHAIATALSNPSLSAELQLALHHYYVRRNDLKAAEQSLASAVLGLLLTEDKAPYDRAKLLVGLIEALMRAQDIVGALQLAAIAEPFIVKTAAPDSVLHAEYSMLRARLHAFLGRHSQTAAELMGASQLYERLDIREHAKLHEVSIANSLACAALVLDGRLDDARALHARHPLQAEKEAILARGAFAAPAEFFFAVSDIILSAAANAAPDARWTTLLTKTPAWPLGELERNDIDSYRNFSLGLLRLGAGDHEEGSRLLRRAATQRLDNFEAVLRANFEGFPLISLVDKLVIATGLEHAVGRSDRDSLDLVLRGSEVMGRSLRHGLVDTAALLAVQPDENARRNVHSYLHLVRHKRDWELAHIRALLAGELPRDRKGALIREYTDAVTALASLKERLLSGSSLAVAHALPNISSLRARLRAGEAFVAYFPLAGGAGKLCVTREEVTQSTALFEPEALQHVRLLEFAVTAAHPASVELDAQYPVASALYLHRLLFGGLEACLRPGTRIAIALPPEFAGVPLGALLADTPPRRGEGYDLRQAHWLIRDVSFSLVASPRHYLASGAAAARRPAPRAFLGVGDPLLDAGPTATLASNAAFRNSLKTPAGLADFKPLPETADELRTVAKLFPAPEADVLLREHGSERSFRAKPLADYDVIHFATHGLLTEELPGLTEPALVLTPGRAGDALDDGLLSASEIARLSLNARLVMLSACNTAHYDVAQMSRGVQDLQTAFTVAGARTLVASLWPIESATARDIATRFFKEWRSGDRAGAADALARATRDFLARADAAHQHPRFWAPFVVVGDGAVSEQADASPSASAPTLQTLDGIPSGGEIIDAVSVGDDLIVSMLGEWDGAKMNAIISRRTPEGRERWRVATRDVGAGRIAAVGDDIYVAGFTTEQRPRPVIRAIDRDGRLRWTARLDELRGHTVSDLLVVGERILAVAFPLAAGNEGSEAVVLALRRDGRPQGKVAIKVNAAGFGFGPGAILRRWGNRLVLAINPATTAEMNADVKTVFGLPSYCHRGAVATLYELDPRDLRILSTRSIENFRVSSLTVLADDLLVGGESLRPCSPKGIASILRLRRTGDAEPMWTDDSLFVSAVRGAVVSGEHLVVAVSQERTLGIDASRRGGDGSAASRLDGTVAREGALLRLSRDGSLIERRAFSAGLDVSFHGITTAGPRTIVYGSLGGMPAYARPPQ